jgi:hypothetical protein
MGNDDQQAKQQQPRLVSRANLEWEATRTATSTGSPCPGASLRARIAGEIGRARSRPLRLAVLRALTCSVVAAILGALASPNPASVLAAASAGAVVGCILSGHADDRSVRV